MNDGEDHDDGGADRVDDDDGDGEDDNGYDAGCWMMSTSPNISIDTES